MILVGVADTLSYFRLRLTPVRVSSNLSEKALSFMKRISYGSSLIAGLFVGMHNFPCACTGGIYPTFVALISNSSLKLPYLILYNIFYVTPMITILYIASSKSVILHVRKWHQQNREKAKLVLGLGMIFTGLLLLGLIYLGLT